MRKILTIYERGQDKKITGKQIVDLTGCFATEKVDGTNIRLTVRNHTLVRVEKRRNPSKLEKQKGIITPWYIDADEYGPEDKYIYEAARNTDLSKIPDGEWSGEAYGPKIQGNPLQQDSHKVFLFSVPEVLAERVMGAWPKDREELKNWLFTQRSTFNSACGIEGIVFWRDNPREPVGKIKVKDFRSF